MGEAEAVQPADADGPDPVQPGAGDRNDAISADEVLAGVHGDDEAASIREQREIRDQQEALRRRMADQQLVQRLAACNFEGAAYETFVNELVRYGVSVLRAWLYSGYIFGYCARRNHGLHPTDAERDHLHRDSEAREDLAQMTVAVTLPRFREHALIKGGWRLDGGASLPTFFVGACVNAFPNEFRRYQTLQRRQHQWASTELVNDDLLDLDGGPATDPGVILAQAEALKDRLHEMDERTRAAALLTTFGYQQDEIAEMLHTSVRAVEGMLYRWRKKKSAGEEDEHGQR